MHKQDSRKYKKGRVEWPKRPLCLLCIFLHCSYCWHLCMHLYIIWLFLGSFVWMCSHRRCVEIACQQLHHSRRSAIPIKDLLLFPAIHSFKTWHGWHQVLGGLRLEVKVHILPYLGKDPSHPSGKRLSKSVVMRLMEPFMDKGRSVTVANFFTSLSLVGWLLCWKTTLLCTVNKNRREILQSARKMDLEEFTTQVCC